MSYRSIKNYSGGRGVVSNLRASSLSRHNNVRTSKNSLITEKDSSSNRILTVELKTYSKIAQNSAQDIEKNGERLIATEENSLFDKAEKTGSTRHVVSEAKDFINNYNNMLSSITKLGGTENKKYISDLKKYAEENKDALKDVGITVLKDGSLTMNRKEMSSASLENLKKVFNGKESFAGKITQLSTDIGKNVEKKLKENLIILGGRADLTQEFSNKKSGSYFNMSI